MNACIILPMKHKLQQLRWEKGWSEERLARESGVSKSTICRLENQKDVNPTIDVAFRIADALKVDVRELFYW
nr:MAG TPA: putative transcriptional regulator [Bacteriophage sp.]